MSPQKIEACFNKYFIKTYLIYSTIVSLIILSSYVLLGPSSEQLLNLRNYLTNPLGYYYLSIIIFSIISFFYFRIIIPQWIFIHARKKLFIDLTICVSLIFSYIPSCILTYSYIYEYFNNFFIYGSYFTILMQIPIFFTGLIATIIAQEYLVGFMLLSFSITRLIAPIILFFSYPAKKIDKAKKLAEILNE